MSYPGQFYLGADDRQIVEAVESAVADWQLGDADESPVIGPDDWASGKHLDGVDRGPTQREVRLLGLIGQGWSNSEIAEELHLGPKIVKSYIRTAYGKIGALNRNQAASWATRHLSSLRGENLAIDNAAQQRDPGESASWVA